MSFDLFQRRLGTELAILAMDRYRVLQAIDPKRGKARGGRVSGLIKAYRSGWVGNSQHGHRMLGYLGQAGRRKPGKVDYGKPVVKRKSGTPRAPRPGARVVVADPPADDYPC